MDSTNLTATVAQLKGITHFGVNNEGETFYFFLQGAGGTLDFSKSFTQPQLLNIEATMATSRVVINKSSFAPGRLASRWIVIWPFKCPPTSWRLERSTVLSAMGSSNRSVAPSLARITTGRVLVLSDSSRERGKNNRVQ